MCTLHFLPSLGCHYFLEYSFGPALFLLWDSHYADTGSSVSVPKVPPLLSYSLFCSVFFSSVQTWGILFLCPETPESTLCHLHSSIAHTLALFLISITMFCRFYNFHLDLFRNFYVFAEMTLSYLLLMSSYNYLIMRNVYRVSSRHNKPVTNSM